MERRFLGHKYGQWKLEDTTEELKKKLHTESGEYMAK